MPGDVGDMPSVGYALRPGVALEPGALGLENRLEAGPGTGEATGSNGAFVRRLNPLARLNGKHAMRDQAVEAVDGLDIDTQAPSIPGAEATTQHDPPWEMLMETVPSNK